MFGRRQKRERALALWEQIKAETPRTLTCPYCVEQYREGQPHPCEDVQLASADDDPRGRGDGLGL